MQYRAYLHISEWSCQLTLNTYCLKKKSDRLVLSKETKLLVLSLVRNTYKMCKMQRFLVLKRMAFYTANFSVKETCMQPVTNKFKNDVSFITVRRKMMSLYRSV